MALPKDGSRADPSPGDRSAGKAADGEPTAAAGAERLLRRPSFRLVWLALALAATAVPFLAVRWAPITDLPQQAAQVRLLGEALADPASPYRVQWTAPNVLALPVLVASWAATSPLAAGRIAMMALALAWVGAVHLLALRRGRPAAAAALASVLVFDQSLYWGFYSFVIGFPVFAGWLLLTADDDPEMRERDRERPWRRAPWLLLVAMLLFMAHALWLAAGLAWLALDTTLGWRRRPLAVHAWRWAAVMPVVARAAIWFASIGDTGMATPALWAPEPWRRLAPEHLAEAAFGGIQGRFETLLLALLLAYLALAVLTRRSLSGGDRHLAAAGAMLFVFTLVLPDKYTNTIFFDERWMPAALALLVLAAPPPRIAGRRWPAAVAVGLAVVALASQALVTAAVWQRVEAEELSGLDAVLAALPESPRVLGLNLGPPSRWLRSAPLAHVPAYAQVARGGELNFSFAQFPSSPVVYEKLRPVTWTPHLELLPMNVKRSDFVQFDWVIASGSEEIHARFEAEPLTEPVTAEGRWRLYRVVPPPAGPPPPPPS